MQAGERNQTHRNSKRLTVNIREQCRNSRQEQHTIQQALAINKHPFSNQNKFTSDGTCDGRPDGKTGASLPHPAVKPQRVTDSERIIYQNVAVCIRSCAAQRLPLRKCQA